MTRGHEGVAERTVADTTPCYDSLRIIADPNEVVRRAPDIIVGSWCGKRFRSEQVKMRPGWEAIPAVRDGEVHESKSADATKREG